MKSALLAAIFGMTGVVAILLAVPAQEKAPVFIIHAAKSWPDYGESMVPQIEEVPPLEVLVPQEMLVPEPLNRYSVAEAKTKKTAPHRHMHVVRHRPNFFEKLVAGFIKLQKREAAKSLGKRSHMTSRRG